MAKQKRLVPKTAQLDKKLNEDIARMWHQFRLISKDELAFFGGRKATPVDNISNEADASSYLHEHIMHPLIRTFDGLAKCAKRRSVSDPAYDPHLLNALNQVVKTGVTHQDTRNFVASPRVEASSQVEADADAVPLARELLGAVVETDPSFQAVSHLLRGSSQALGTDLYDLPDRKAIELAKARYTQPVPDMNLCWFGSPDVTEVRGGMPFLVMEIKDPNKLNYDVMARILFNLDEYLEGDVEKQAVRDSGGVIPLRLLFCHENSTMRKEANRFLGAFTQLYHELFFARQTFGLLTSAQAALAMRIDWDHIDEPGQHVHFALLDCRNLVTEPAWLNSKILCDLFHYSAGLAALQLRTGLVSMKTFERAIVRIADSHGAYQKLQESNGKGLGDRRQRKRKADDLTAGSSKRSQATLRQLEEAETNATPFDVNCALLELFKDPRCKAEVQRFLNLDETKVAIPFRKTELLKILCGVYPLNLDKIARNSTDGQAVRDKLSPFVQCPRPTIQSITDPDLFNFGTLREGYLPEQFNQRLAWVDFPETARLMAVGAKRDQYLSVGKPPGSVCPNQETETGTDFTSSRSSSASYATTAPSLVDGWSTGTDSQT